jgi:hypothetical protein
MLHQIVQMKAGKLSAGSSFNWSKLILQQYVIPFRYCAYIQPNPMTIIYVY